MRVLVAGGTGFIGRGLVRGLLTDGSHAVSVLARKAPDPDPFDGRVAFVTGDVTRPETLPDALAGQEAVVDAVQFPNSPIEDPSKGRTFEAVDLQGTRNLVDAAKAAGVSQYIDISGAGAAVDSRYHWRRFKWQEEQHLKDSGMPFTIFRPSWVYGPEDVSLNRFLGFAKFLPFVPVIGNGKTRIHPLFIDDLGRHVAAAIGNEKAIGRTFEIGGPEVLTMDEIVKAGLKAAGKRRMILHQPTGSMKFVASVLQHSPGRPLTPDAVEFITLEGVVDTTELEATFGLPLTPIDDALATYLPQ